MRYEKSNSKFGNTGLGTKGLQIFLPLSPQYLLVFYDGVTYEIGKEEISKEKEFIVDVVDINDVRQMNDLQWLNSLENVYYHHHFSPVELEKMRQRNQAREHSEKSILNEYPQKEYPDGSGSSILLTSRPDFKIGLNPQFIRLLSEPTNTELNTMPRPSRNPDRRQLHEEFIEFMQLISREIPMKWF